MRDVYYSVDFGIRELKVNLEKCIYKNVVDIYYGIFSRSQKEFIRYIYNKWIGLNKINMSLKKLINSMVYMV